MSELDESTWKSYVKAQSLIKNIPKEDLERFERKKKNYEKNKAIVYERNMKNLREQTPEEKNAYNLHRKELAHKRKLKIQLQKETDLKLDMLRAERARACGNVFGKIPSENGKIPSENGKIPYENGKIPLSKSEQFSDTTFDDLRSDIYCSTCDEREIKREIKPSSPIPIPPPMKVQNYFERLKSKRNIFH